MTIRVATRADLAGIDALLGRSYPALLKEAYPPSVLVTAIPLISRANPSLVSSGTYFVVTDPEGGLLGAGGWTAREPTTGRAGAPSTGHVRHVVADRRHVREGIGRALMGHVVEHARGHGMIRLDCLSTLMAVPFYSACGFDEVRPVSVALRPGIDFPAVLMQRSL